MQPDFGCMKSGGVKVSRLSFCKFRSVVGLIAMSCAFAPPVVGVATAQSPAPAITAISTSGMAPFTVHVHGLSSTLGLGNENTARYDWTFGDSAGSFNTLTGFNAAHTYNNPGTYTITLKITNQSGVSASTTRQVTVGSNTRSVIYVSPSGNDANAGTSQSAPIRTFDRARQLLANNRAIYFQRGATYNTSSGMYISQQNMIIGAYGSGTAPVFNFTSGANYAKIVDFDSAARDILVENVRFDSNFTPNNMIVRGLQPHGTNITVRNCFFNKVSYAMNCGGGGANGLFVQSNQADALGAYFVWGEGSNHAYVGNSVVNSIDEHNIRIGGVSKLLIAHNDLFNDDKATIWCMLGDHHYIINNILRGGRFIAGPNFAVSSSGERTPWLVFENNQIINQGVVLYSGAENMMFRNNIITHNGGECFSVWGYLPEWNRTVKNITIVNNTGLNNASSYGKFMKLGDGAESITVANNLYRATSLGQPYAAGNIISDDANLQTQSFHHNLWSNPASGTYVHYVGGGAKTQSQWASMGGSSEQYRSFSTADLNSQYVPQFSANIGVQMAGVRLDYYGNARPTTGAMTVGAVETNSVPPVIVGDITSDGSVDVDDLLAVLGAWGTCANPNSCPSDVDHNGTVNVNDMLAVLHGWN